MLGLGINISKYQAPSGGLPLDLFPGAIAAYSMRELSKDWTDQAVIRVRRDSDNAESDFTATQVADGTMESFCSGTRGSITVWYDQTGNGKSLTQTNLAQQPFIVELTGVWSTRGYPGASYTPDQNVLRLRIANGSGGDVFNFTDTCSVHAVWRPKTITTNSVMLLKGFNNYQVSGWYFNAHRAFLHFNQPGISNFMSPTPDATILNNINISSMSVDAGNGNGLVNNVSASGTNLVATTNTEDFKIGYYTNAGGGLLNFYGIVHELIMYDQPTNYSSIHNLLNSYYKVF